MTRAARIVAVSLAALLAGCGGRSPAAHRAGEPGPADTDVFAAEHDCCGIGSGSDGTSLSLFAEVSGSFLRDVEHVPGRFNMLRTHLAGYSRSPDGFVYALVKGPSDNPYADQHTCGGTVYDYDVATGRTRALFSVGDDVNLSDPVESPTGTRIAYERSACTQAVEKPGFDRRIVIRDLASGKERTIWLQGTSAVEPQWRPDGKALLFKVGPFYAAGFNGSKGGYYGEAGFVIVGEEAHGAQPASAVRYPPDRGCQLDHAVFTGSDVAMLMDCRGEDPGLQKTAREHPGIGGVISIYPERLVQLVGDGPQVAWTADTGLCPAMVLAGHDAHGRLLLTGETCDDPARPDNAIVVQIWAGQRISKVDRFAGGEGVHGAV